MAFIRRRDLSRFSLSPSLNGVVLRDWKVKQKSTERATICDGGRESTERREGERGVRNFPVNTFLHILQLPSLIQAVVSKSDALSMNLRTFGVRGRILYLFWLSRSFRQTSMNCPQCAMVISRNNG